MRGKPTIHMGADGFPFVAEVGPSRAAVMTDFAGGEVCFGDDACPFQFAASSQVSTTTPAISCPRMTGGQQVYSPLSMCRSVPQIPAAQTSTTTYPALARGSVRSINTSAPTPGLVLTNPNISGIPSLYKPLPGSDTVKRSGANALQAQFRQNPIRISPRQNCLDLHCGQARSPHARSLHETCLMETRESQFCDFNR